MAKTRAKRSVDAPQHPTARRVQMKADDKTPVFYANNVGVEGSNFDVRIRFGLIETASEDLVTVRDTAHVYLTHEQAKAMIRVVSETIGKVESFKAAEAAHEVQH